jgi:hypothetical protein
VAWFRHRVVVEGAPLSITLESARKSVDMDSFAAAGKEGSISGAAKYAKLVSVERRAPRPAKPNRRPVWGRATRPSARAVGIVFSPQL